MAVISAQNIHKFFYFQHQKTVKELVQAAFFGEKTLEKIHALKNVTFDINEGETVGIIGKNGAGKSTLLKLIAGVSSPTSGTLKVTKRVAPLIELGAGFHPELNGRENIFLNGVIMGLKESYIRKRFKEIVDFAEVEEFMDTPLKYYSSGMYMRLAFSVAVFTNPEILLVDEILAVGDEGFQKKCMDKMNEFKKNGTTIIYVSHAMQKVDSFCERVIYLDRGSVKYDGGASEGVELYRKSL